MDMITATYAASKAKAELAANGQVGYVGKDWKEFYPETGIVIADDMGASLTPMGLVDGNTYRVVFNGVEYICVGASVDVGGTVAVVLGNSALMTETGNTGEPFIISEFEHPATPGTLMCSVMCIDFSNPDEPAILNGTHTLAIYEGTEKVHTIDDKFLGILDTEEVSELTWDGDTAGREVVYANDAQTMGWCRISSLLPTKDNFAGGSAINSRNNEILFEADAYAVTEDTLAAYDCGTVVTYKDNVTPPNFVTTLPKAGVWVVFSASSGVHISKLTFGTPVAVRTINPNYLPGVCLPVVELETVVATGNTFAESDNEALNSVFAKSLPIIIRGTCVSSSVEFIGSLIGTPSTYAGGRLIVCALGADIKFLKSTDGCSWIVSATP